MTPDRHVRRSGDDYFFGLANLLPEGLAWPRHIGSLTMKVTKGLANIWGFVDARAADLLEQESDPRTTIELLPDWERNWGLPDECFPPTLTIDERQRALVQRMTIQGGQSREFFIDVASQLGYSISITEFRPFVVGIDRCGDDRLYGVEPPPMHNEWGQLILDVWGNPVSNGELSDWPNYGIGPPEMRFYWTVHVGEVPLNWFRCASGQVGVDHHLEFSLAEDLECVLNRWKPAHTQIIFDYSGLSSPSDPMAGTP